MTELRWGKNGLLQYRSLVPTWQASGAWGEPSQWSDWKDVPFETADPTGKQPQGDNTPPLDDGVTFKDGGGGYIR